MLFFGVSFLLWREATPKIYTTLIQWFHDDYFVINIVVINVDKSAFEAYMIINEMQGGLLMFGQSERKFRLIPMYASN